MPGTRIRGTDLHHNYAKCINIRLPCILTISHDHLWCGPPRCKPPYAGYKYRVQPTNNGGKAEIGQTGTATMIDENVELVGVLEFLILMKAAESKHSPLSNLHVLCVRHEDRPDLLLCPITWKRSD